MNLKIITISISSIIIFFCLLLIFQKPPLTSSIDLESFRHLDYSYEQTRSLEDFNQLLKPRKLEQYIQELMQINRSMGLKTRVMEMGTGDGRVLMELRVKFPEVELYGLNKEKTKTLHRRESYYHTALHFGIFSNQKISQVNLPYIVFRDLNLAPRIPYDEEKFDIIFSQETFRYLKNKIEILNETHRILKPKGLSIHAHLGDLKFYNFNIPISLRDLSELLRKKRFYFDIVNENVIVYRKGKDYRPLPLRARKIALKNDEEEIVYDLIN